MEEKPPQEIEFTLNYNKDDEKLNIYILRAKNLRQDIQGITKDVLLRIVLVRDLKKGWLKKQKSDVSIEDIYAGFDTCEFRTQIIRRNLNPQFNEYFTADLKEKDKKHATLKLALCSVDNKSNKHKVVAECYMNMARLDLSQFKEFSLELRPYRPEIGQIELTLSYLPTAERVCLTIGRCARLKFPADYKIKPGMKPNTFIKVALLNRGKTIEKHKTPIRWSSIDPEFKEVLTFDVPVKELQKVVLLLTVLHQEMTEKGPTRTKLDRDSLTGEETSSSSGGSGKKHHSPEEMVRSSNIDDRRLSSANMLRHAGDGPGLTVKSVSTGTIYTQTSLALGRLAIGHQAQECSHWLEMLRNPRQPITKWHPLIP